MQRGEGRAHSLIRARKKRSRSSGEKVDLFVGYDSHRIDQSIGQFITELAYTGDYNIPQGDEADNNAALLYEGACYIDPIRADINVILDAPVAKWAPEAAKETVLEAVAANKNHVDAILAPNDNLAAGSIEALEELGVQGVVVTGMDAQLDAAKRIVAGTQAMTVYMDLKSFRAQRSNWRVNMATGKKVEVNAEYDNRGDALIPANLLSGQVVTRENLDKILIDGGFLSRKEVYGTD